MQWNQNPASGSRGKCGVFAVFRGLSGAAGRARPSCTICPGGARPLRLLLGQRSGNLAVERWSEEDDPDTSYHVECLKCGCNGPQAETQLEGAEGWNGRNG